MSEENQKTTNGEQEESFPVGKVELDPDTYQALLDRIAELEERSEAVGQVQRTSTSTLDDLAEEGKSRVQEQPATRELPSNIDDMSNTEVVHLVVDEINKQAAIKLNSLELEVHTLRILREIDKAELKYDDFWLYEDKVKEFAMANPSVSIEDAYLLAKQKSPKKKEEEGENVANKKTATERLLNLPSRQALGEKPGVAVSSTAAAGESHTLKSAAKKAWDEQVGKGKLSVDG